MIVTWHASMFGGLGRRGEPFGFGALGQRGDEPAYAAVAAQIFSEHAGVPRDDHSPAQRAKQHDYLRGCIESSGDWGSVSDDSAGQSGYGDLRRRGKQGESDGDAAADVAEAIE